MMGGFKRADVLHDQIGWLIFLFRPSINKKSPFLSALTLSPSSADAFLGLPRSFLTFGGFVNLLAFWYYIGEIWLFCAHFIWMASDTHGVAMLALSTRCPLSNQFLPSIKLNLLRFLSYNLKKKMNIYHLCVYKGVLNSVLVRVTHLRIALVQSYLNEILTITLKDVLMFKSLA
ncbi:hypothetical protein IEQ34_005862 [Dendrobium chrysotoxum]|uniref:Uncharacterized protein n=1 Tax=Dendrobium chrysotoxum TaxID=161865 RepID=A0AAV7HCH4_DENCH|nr:hypothetical protein IEQ34_005862 [Dendrobium chrysotoxum]